MLGGGTALDGASRCLEDPAAGYRKKKEGEGRDTQKLKKHEGIFEQ